MKKSKFSNMIRNNLTLEGQVRTLKDELKAIQAQIPWDATQKRVEELEQRNKKLLTAICQIRYVKRTLVRSHLYVAYDDLPGGARKFLKRKYLRSMRRESGKITELALQEYRDDFRLDWEEANAVYAQTMEDDYPDFDYDYEDDYNIFEDDSIYEEFEDPYLTHDYNDGPYCPYDDYA